jgi:hypothetical protein
VIDPDRGIDQHSGAFAPGDDLALSGCAGWTTPGRRGDTRF